MQSWYSAKQCQDQEVCQALWSLCLPFFGSVADGVPSFPGSPTLPHPVLYPVSCLFLHPLKHLGREDISECEYINKVSLS